MEWTSVDSCMATSRQGPNPYHVEGIQTSYGSNPLVLHLFIQAVYNNMSGSAFRRNNMARLHVFPGEEVEMLFNLINKYTLKITQSCYIFFVSTCPFMLAIGFSHQVPEEIMKNVTSQIPQVKPVPKKLSDYTEEEMQSFPKVFDYPENLLKK